ncbi:MAG: TorD/DmsD family molecular chaperone [Planctomycetota bacterium]|jgi:TorA maturation chaperone TorD
MAETLVSIFERADSYKLLSECYYLPDDKLMEKIDDAARSDRFFAKLASHIPPAIELELLKVDYAGLFVGPYKLLAPPYGSVYLEDKRIMGDSTIDVRNCYENEDLDIVIKDAPDHIAVELEFMYYLVVKQIMAIRDADSQTLLYCLQKQYSFLWTHLTRWLPEFAENVKKKAQTEFYKNLAQQTKIFVQKDLDIYALCYNGSNQ